ncbi:MAG: hypothetical protein Q9180_007416, partial [Flavoplaca navasiana]
FVLGSAVAGVTPGSNPGKPDDGAFATYIRAPASLIMLITPQVKLAPEEAATLETALATFSLAFRSHNALALVPATPEQPAEQTLSVLVYEGIRSRGASAVFDYTDLNIPSAIKKHTGGQLKYVVDCISDPQSVEACFGAMSRIGGRYVELELVPEEFLAKRRAVHARLVMAFEILKEVKLPGGYGTPANPEKGKLGIRFFGIFQHLLSENKLVAHPTQRLEGGLEAIGEDLQLLKSGYLSGKKLSVILSNE